MNQILNQLHEEKLISIIRGVSSKDISKAVEALYEGGIHFVEVTFRPGDEQASNDTLLSIQKLVKEFKNRMYIGAGTVLTPEQVTLVKKAGGMFIISPDTNVDVIKKTKELGMLSIPGALTPSEAVTAWNAGADLVKIFPAGVMGPQYIKAIKASLSQLKISAVGGVSEDNIPAFLDVGVDGFGIGSNLVNADIVEKENWQEITNHAKKYVKTLKEYYNSSNN